MSEPTLEQLKRDYIKALDLIASMRQERDKAQAHECPSVFNQHWSKEAEFDKSVMEAERIANINGYAISTNPDNPLYAEIDRLRAENERLKGETSKAHWLKGRAEKQLAESTADLKQADSQLAEQGARLAGSQVEVQRLKEVVRRLNRGNWLRVEEAQVKEETQNVFIKDLQSALVSMGHEEYCPVVWGASVDCVPGSGCVDYRVIAEKATAEAVVLKAALEGANWIIGKLAPFEAMAISVRGHQPAKEDIETGARYRRMIDNALASTSLAAAHMAKDEAMRKALEFYADPTNYAPTRIWDNNYTVWMDDGVTPIGHDGGAKARRALEGENA